MATPREKTFDIRWNQPWPSGDLSNFAPRQFTLHGLLMGSIEGFLQGLKASDVHEQREIFLLSSLEAKERGGTLSHVRKTQTLWWQGRPIDRHGDEYQMLLDEAYVSMFLQSSDAREALLATGDVVLTHRIGWHDPHQTVLTEEEFCDRLMMVRSILQTEIRNGRMDMPGKAAAPTPLTSDTDEHRGPIDTALFGLRRLKEAIIFRRCQMEPENPSIQDRLKESVDCFGEALDDPSSEAWESVIDLDIIDSSVKAANDSGEVPGLEHLRRLNTIRDGLIAAKEAA